MSNLMIIESPGKRKKLLEILGKLQPGVQWKIEASVGHVRDLPSKGLAEGHIVTGIKSDFTPTYELSERGAEIIAKLKKAVKEADNVYLATDPDREGESISWHLQQALGLKNPIRVSFNDISLPVVKEGMASPGTINVPKVAAQEARRVLDRLVGYMVSPELWRQTGERLSAGRVQSPAVYLVVTRERQRRAFKRTDHFGVRLNFADAKSGNWRAEWATKPNFVTEESPYFMDRRFAELVSGVPRVRVISCVESEESRNPPAAFSTSTLQQAASNALGFNPKKAMALAQSLYEQGHITYMRTDSPNIAEDSMGALRDAAESLGLEVVAQRRVFKSKDGAQEGHPAITPTHWEVAEAGETDEERALYKLIRLRALASQLLAARYSARTVKLVAENPIEGRTVDFETKGRTLIFDGWLKLLADDVTEEKPDGEDDGPNPIPKLEPGQLIDVTKGELLAKATKAPPRYTEASLIKALESEGIGRPATYAAIMDNILGRAYVELEKRFLKPTTLGERVVDALVGNFEFIELGFTSELENDLDDIAEGKAAYRSVIQKLYTRLEKEIEAQKSKVPTFVKEVETFPCPACKAPLRRIAKGANGPFWGCTRHPECSETLPDVGGKPGQKKPKVAVLSNFACAKCGKPLVQRELTGKPGVMFWGCSGFKAGCRTAYPDKGGEPNYARAK